MKRILFYVVMVLIPVGFGVLTLACISYWTIAPSRVTAEGDPIIVFDKEIGFVPRPNSRTVRTDTLPNGLLKYTLYTDRIGARVSAPGDQTPATVDILFIGDSFTWGHGVENSKTFAALVARTLGVTEANVAMGSYGTTHSLLMLRRVLHLKPKLVVYAMTSAQMYRNVSACASSYYPFCLDWAYVALDGGARIVPPASDGVRRAQLHAEYDRRGLPLWSWFAHGVDVAESLIVARRSQRVAASASQDDALAFLMAEVARTTDEIGAELFVISIPFEAPEPPPSKILTSGRYRFTDLSAAFKRGDGLYIPHDGHLSTAGHALVASQLVKIIKADSSALKAH